MENGAGKLDRALLLESVLLWEGRLNNGRVRALFALSAVRASEWIREFRDRHPTWLNWDSITRSYHATAEVYRSQRASAEHEQAVSESLNRYLALIGMPHAAGHDPVRSPAIWSAFPDFSPPPPRVFATLVEAIRTKRQVRIAYRSLREPTKHNRLISPHNLIRAGRRWHVRAYCSKNEDFRDYTLGRIAEIKVLNEPTARSEDDDRDWATKVKLRIVAHPALTIEQQKLIRFEYFGARAARVDICRGALVGYFIQDIRAAIDTDTQLPPNFQLAIANIEDVKQWLFPA